jgi:hypothetical protein
MPAGPPGDAPAEGRLLITDTASQNRRYIEWGLESRWYNPATSLMVESDDLVTSGFSGSQTTRTGAYDVGGGNTVVRATLISSPLAVCGTGNLAHVGSFRVHARVYASAAGQFVRLVWSEGDGPLRANHYAVPPVSAAWSDVDLGMISVPQKTLGTQRWQGRVEAYTTGAAGTDTLDVDFMLLVPCGEGYGKVRAAVTYETPTIHSARDEFAQTAGALTGKTAPIGGVWAGAGDATDLTVETSGHTLTRSEVSDAAFTGRYVISGAAAQTLQAVQADVKWSAYCGFLSSQWHGVLARYVDTNNWLAALFVVFQNGASVFVRKRVAGVVSTLKGSSVDSKIQPGNFYTLRLVADTGGKWYCWASQQGVPSSAPLLSDIDTDLATGGALASGKAGILDENNSTTAVVRNYDNMAAFTPTIPTALYAGRVAEIRYDGAIRQDSTGTYWGPTPSYRGSPFYVPCAGDKDRPYRVFVRANRNDLETEPYDNVTDNLQVQTISTPRGIVVPM